MDKATARVAARTRAARRPALPDARVIDLPAPAPAVDPVPVVPFGLFDVDAETER